MTVSYKLCGGDGTVLLATQDGKLVLALAQADDVSVSVETFNPACGSIGNSTGWAVGWKVWIGGVLKAGDEFVAHSAGEDTENTHDEYAGTVTTQNPTIVVQLQLRAWHRGNVTPPNGTEEVDRDGGPIYPSDIGWAVSVGGVTESSDFTKGTIHQGSWDSGSGYVEVVGTYDFARSVWVLSSTDVPNP